MKLSAKTITDYLTITSGVLGRLAISVVYFLIVANILSLGEFGVFASASAVGLVLSRLMAFGFISPVYRVATVKPLLLGTYVAGLIAFVLLSLPLVFGAAFVSHMLFFAGKIAVLPFLIIVGAEILCWRVTEYVVIMLNGLSRFGKAATLVIIGSAMRTVAAVVFYVLPWRGLEAWVYYYLAANILTLIIALWVFAPSMRLRFAWRLYPRRMRDAVTAALSELTFYVQSELDKVLVLGMAGDRTAGLYAIAMRLIDLTAIPVRSFNQMLVQHLMKEGAAMAGKRRRILVECVIAVVSTAGLMAFIVLLWLYPAIMGDNVARVAPYLLLMLAIPALRNLIEYHAELLYAREKVVTRAALLAGLATIKLSMMAALLSVFSTLDGWVLPLTGVFVALYAVSAFVSYRQLSR
jgi:O-antigen/teichoic acid export membrane protein